MLYEYVCLLHMVVHFFSCIVFCLTMGPTSSMIRIKNQSCCRISDFVALVDRIFEFECNKYVYLGRIPLPVTVANQGFLRNPLLSTCDVILVVTIASCEKSTPNVYHVFLYPHGNLKVPPQCHPPPRTKALISSY